MGDDTAIAVSKRGNIKTVKTVLIFPQVSSYALRDILI